MQTEQARRKQLQAQINPHFLYNTLNSVSSLIKMNCPDEAFIMIQAIGTFYRTSLSDGKTLITAGTGNNKYRELYKNTESQIWK